MPSSSSSSSGPLVCPRCAVSHPLEERFCSNCGMPLVYAGGVAEEPASESQRRARKVKPQYSRGEPVKVGFARNQAEAELIQGLLLEEGIPSFLKRTRGFDVPDFLAAGPRDILVPEAGLETARDLLEHTPVGERPGSQPPGSVGPRPWMLLAGIVAAFAAAVALAWVLFQVGP